MYKVQPYTNKFGNDSYYLLDCNNNYKIVPEVDSFLQYAELRKFSPHTIQAYAYDLMHFYNYCESVKTDPLHLDSSRNMLNTFSMFASYLLTHKNNDNIVSIDKPARTGSTVNRIMSTIYNYYRYLSYTNLAPIPLALTGTSIAYRRNFLSELIHAKIQNYNLFRMKTGKKNIKYITREQFWKLFNACHSLRDKLIVAMLFEGGLRCSEVCGIHIEDLAEIEHRILRIVPRDNNINKARVKNHAKGNIYLPQYVINMIVEYISDRREDSDYLFLTTQGSKAGSPITRRNVTRLFEQLTKRTGIDAHPHMLRHGFAVEKIADGWDIFEVQRYLRHKNPTSTETYAEFTDEAIVKRMNEFYTTHGLEMEDLDYVKE